MSSGDFIILKQFSMPVCNKCGAAAAIVITDDGGCDDPECGCGGYSEYAVVVCKGCKVDEKIS